uniref:Oxysterol-binding protein n=1 Tax=Dromaius novaehollandiae TaxID=8790 RepID=A0A8C4JAJ8_DRONO
ADSHTEFFDACEVFLSASSSENEVGGARPRGLWNILRNNIGKDLSKVSMPVQLNEPLNTLQRLCEELEYSGLLDRASRCPDPCQRLVYVAAFAVSAYASTYYRAGSKPFNPVLGETYECVRPDRGFRFISEQVCHHPPISACHAESDNFIFWQDMKWKNKFWGKSLEIVPMGTVNVRSGDHFEWNKVTTCIHNILSGPRWIEHYGEVLIRNTRDAAFHCKITFCKVEQPPSNLIWGGFATPGGSRAVGGGNGDCCDVGDWECRWGTRGFCDAGGYWEGLLGLLGGDWGCWQRGLGDASRVPGVSVMLGDAGRGYPGCWCGGVMVSTMLRTEGCWAILGGVLGFLACWGGTGGGVVLTSAFW